MGVCVYWCCMNMDAYVIEVITVRCMRNLYIYYDVYVLAIYVCNHECIYAWVGCTCVVLETWVRMVFVYEVAWIG